MPTDGRTTIREDSVTPLAYALAYAARGWRVASITPGQKYPRLQAWQDKATTDPAVIETWWHQFPDDGVSIVTGDLSRLVVVDVDPDHDGDETLRALEATHGHLPDTVEAVTGGGGRHLYFHMPDGVAYPRNDQAGIALGAGVDIRGQGGQVVAPPTVHPITGQRYEWEIEHSPLDGIAVAEAPPWLVELLTAPPPERKPCNEHAAAVGDRPGDIFAQRHTWPELLTPVGWQFHSSHTQNGDTYELWTRPGKEPRHGASASLYYRGSDVLKVFTSSAAPLEAGHTYDRWGFHVATTQGTTDDVTMAAAARDYRRQIAMEAATFNVHSNGSLALSAPPNAPHDDIEPGDQPYTDLGNARRLTAAHGHDLRWSPQLGSWLHWDGNRWTEDLTDEAHRRAKAVVDAMVTELALAPEAKRKALFGHWMRSQAATRLRAMVDVARTEPGIPILVRDLDADPWALNTRTGVIDLRTGDVAGHDRRSHVTKLAPITLDFEARCPIWEWFIHWAMKGDEALIAFLQRSVGYSLTGLTTEQVMFFLHGAGENGKSTFLNVLQRLMGDYAIAAAPDLLLATHHEQHPTGMADLVGRRLAVVQETEEGRRFAESTLKQLTGGDRIKARRMRQDFFEFDATHKIWMAANHRPQVRGTDHAIWRRIRLIPFDAHIEGRRDDHLLDKLVAELPGILNWALAGVVAWQKVSLASPPAVSEATAQYRNEQDHIGRFIEDVCVLGPEWKCTARELRGAYENWCQENGERPWSARAMAPQLVERDCHRVQEGRNKTWTWLGISLEETPTTSQVTYRQGEF